MPPPTRPADPRTIFFFLSINLAESSSVWWKSIFLFDSMRRRRWLHREPTFSFLAVVVVVAVVDISTSAELTDATTELALSVFAAAEVSCLWAYNSAIVTKLRSSLTAATNANLPIERVDIMSGSLFVSVLWCSCGTCSSWCSSARSFLVSSRFIFSL